MTEAEYDNSLSDYEWHEEDEREQLLFFFFFFFEKTKKGAWDDSRSEQRTCFTQGEVSQEIIPPCRGILQMLEVYSMEKC